MNSDQKFIIPILFYLQVSKSLKIKSFISCTAMF